MRPNRNLDWFYQAYQKNDLKLLKQCISKDPTLVNAANDLGITALHIASFHHSNNFVKILIDHGADPTQKDIEGRNAIHHLCLSRMSELFTEELLTIFLKTEKVIAFGVENFINQETANGRSTPLHFAAYYDSFRIAEILVKNNAKLDCENIQNFTPLELAFKQKNEDLFSLLKNKAATQDSVIDHFKKNPIGIGRLSCH